MHTVIVALNERGTTSSKQSQMSSGRRRPPESLDLEEWVMAALEALSGGGQHGSSASTATSADSVLAGVTSLDLAEEAVATFRKMERKRLERGANMVGYVEWSDLLDVLMAEMSPSDLMRGEVNYFTHSGKFRGQQHARRETIQKVIGVATSTTYVYIVVSKFGKVGIYDDKFRLQRRYEVDIDTDPDADLDVAASDPGWITDGLWMDNSKHAVYVTSLRTVHFYDASASVHFEEYRAFGLRSIPTCVDYHFDMNDPEGESHFFFGDDGGGVSVILFRQPVNSLFAKDEVDSVQTVFWADMAKHAEFAVVRYTPAVHADGVLGLKYLPHNRTVITVSRDPRASVLIRHMNGKFDHYVFKLPWGVRCFDFERIGHFQVLATGSNDKLVRLWHPVVVSRPTAVLVGHKGGINEVKIHTGRRLVISYDRACVLKVWGLDDGLCKQTLPLAFPALSILGRETEFGRLSLYIDTGSPSLVIVTCCSHMASVLWVEDEEGASEESSDMISDGRRSRGGHLSPGQQEGKQSRPGSRQERLARPKSALSPAANNVAQAPTPSPNNTKRSAVVNRYLLAASASPESSAATSSSLAATFSAIGWTSVRAAIDYRMRGKVFRKGALEDECEYAGFRYFRVNATKCATQAVTLFFRSTTPKGLRSRSR